MTKEESVDLIKQLAVTKSCSQPVPTPRQVLDPRRIALIYLGGNPILQLKHNIMSCSLPQVFTEQRSDEESQIVILLAKDPVSKYHVKIQYD